MHSSLEETTTDLGAQDAYAAGHRDASAASRPRLWVFRLPMLGPLRDQYTAYVRMYDRDLTRFFESTPRLTDDDRDEAREAVTRALRCINAQQWVGALGRRVKPSLTWVAVWPAPCVFAAGAWLMAVRLVPPIAVAYLVIAAFYLLVTYLSVFRTAENRGYDVDIPNKVQKPPLGSAAGWLLALLAATAVVPRHSLGESAAALGSLLIALPLTLVTVLVLALTVEGIPKIQWRAGVFLVEVAILALLSAVQPGHRPGWLGWVTHGAWIGIWASTALAGVLAVLLLLMHLSIALHLRWKSRHAIEEVVQTLLWLVLRIDDAARPEPERSELSRKFPLPDAYALVWDLEYVARLIEGQVPKLLDTGDPAGNRAVTDRCRGIAARVRELKPGMLLNQRGCLARLAEALSGAIVPIAVGDWSALSHTALDVRPPEPSLWVRTLRWIGRVAAATAPVLIVGAVYLDNEESKLIQPLAPVAVTWLLVSVVTWIDPSGGDRASSVKNLLGAVPGLSTKP